jgi:hypothetical protein
MTDEKLARLRAHDNNVSRYRWLLKTNLSELERRFLERRLSEEMSAIESLANHSVSTTSVGIADQFETGALWSLLVPRAQKITIGEMRESGPYPADLYCGAYRCAHWIVVRDLEPLFAARLAGMVAPTYRAAVWGSSSHG